MKLKNKVEQGSWSEMFEGLLIFIVVVGGFAAIMLVKTAHEAFEQRAAIHAQIEANNKAE